MDVYKAYNMAASAYLSVQALPLLLTPRIIVSMLAVEPRRMTDLEGYLSRSLALIMLAFAALNLLLTGAVPLTESIAANIIATDKDGLSQDPYAYPTLTVTTGYHALTAFYAYTQVTQRPTFALVMGMLFSSALFCVGMWLLLFGNDKSRLSKTTGADKRTGNFPFENKESAREKKKEEKERDREREKEREKSEKTKRRSMARTNSSKS